jgi:GT2 family glycosyltransferase
MTDQLEIIYCYRDRDQDRIKNSLESLAAQTNKHFRVLFIDYGSNDQSAAKTKQLCDEYSFCHYVYIDTEGKMWNRSEALNFGIRLSTAQYVFTSDIDLIFREDFIAHLCNNLDQNEVIFFPVGYLSEKETAQAGKKKFRAHSFEKSTNVALGMVLFPKAAPEKINGYNSFYSIWGQEDNDLKERLDKAGYKTSYCHEVLMLHQHHPPSSTDKNSVPEGWIQYMKDYSENFRSKPHSFRGLNEINVQVSRPAKKLARSSDTNFENIKFRKLFLRQFLLQAVTVSTDKNLCYSVHPIEMSANSGTVRLVNTSEKIVSAINLPVRIKAAHEDQYISIHEIRSEILFVVKSLEHFIEDYFLETSSSHVKLVIVKK